eukprot:Plantae.Rhodophyta-Palmaria_palmata.ctg12830.p1 GENE.Plantae.Rhodophyta-Palmaria_palmata.ctg12830~~Plantae.Rhodophyta-Palmaria_palmata.ctg12830.p1  ORF type:complete len:200 (+),score=34.09 Plantae.Rhodophyta-Palmaria_palmata.ctg12830:141-740(+)
MAQNVTPSKRSNARKTPFQMQHETEFGVRLSARDVQGNVESVECLSCIHLGGDLSDVGAVLGRKRMSTGSNQTWTSPFRKESFRSHMEGQHKKSWFKYSALSRSDKQSFFKETGGGRLANYFQIKGEGHVIIGEDIEDQAIGGLFFRTEEVDDEDGFIQTVEVSREVALRLFKKEMQEGGGRGDKFVVRIPNKKLFFFW